MENVEQIIKRDMENLGFSRLEVISYLGLGERSEAARRALENRYRRKHLMESGHDFETACLIVNREKIENEKSPLF